MRSPRYARNVPAHYGIRPTAEAPRRAMTRRVHETGAGQAARRENAGGWAEMTQNDPVPKLPKKERAAGCWCRALNMHMRLAHVFLRIAWEPKLFRQNLDLLEKSHGALRPGGVPPETRGGKGAKRGTRSPPPRRPAPARGGAESAPLASAPLKRAAWGIICGTCNQ